MEVPAINDLILQWLKMVDVKHVELKWGQPCDKHVQRKSAQSNCPIRMVDAVCAHAHRVESFIVEIQLFSTFLSSVQ